MLRGPLASPGHWLKRTALAYQRTLDAALRPLDLTTPQFSMLAGASWLSLEGEPPTQQAVADFAGADRMMTSKILQVLEGRGLIERRRSAADGRVRRIVLTDAGRALVTESTAIARHVDRTFFGPGTDLRDLLIAQFGHLAGPSPHAAWASHDAVNPPIRRHKG